MRLLCPFCQKAITVADSESGKAVNCPECNQQFAAPQLIPPSTPMTLPSSAPKTTLEPTSFPVPVPVPETHPSAVPSERSIPADSLPPPRIDREPISKPGSFAIPLEPTVVRWLPLGALAFAFILTFFSWNGLYPAKYPAYTQNAWQGLFGSVSRDAVAENDMAIGNELDNRVKSSWWLLPYLLLLFPALALALAGPLVNLLQLKLPPSIESIWQYRPALLGIFALVTLMFLLAQWASGFGLQRAVNAMVEERYSDSKELANTPERLQSWEMRVAAHKGAYHVKTTPWLRLAVLFHLIAAASVIAEAGLTLRGDKKPPRLGVTW